MSYYNQETLLELERENTLLKQELHKVEAELSIWRGLTPAAVLCEEIDEDGSYEYFELKTNIPVGSVLFMANLPPWTKEELDLAKVVAAEMMEFFSKDNCEVCHGESGGVKGNENIVDGKVMCDYCSCKQMVGGNNGKV